MRKSKKIQKVKTKTIKRAKKTIKKVSTIIETVETGKEEKPKVVKEPKNYTIPYVKRTIENGNVEKVKVIKKKAITPFEKAMEQVKILGDKMLADGEDDKNFYRLQYGMDESGYPIKGFDLDTGAMKMPQKRGRKPNAEKPNPPVKIKIEKEVKKVKKVKKNKTETKTKPKKKVKGGRGRVATAPTITFNSKDNLKDCQNTFNSAMKSFFADKYTNTSVIIDGVTLKVSTGLTEKTEKKPTPTFFVMFTLDNKSVKYYEYNNKLSVAKFFSYHKYLKPTKVNK